MVMERVSLSILCSAASTACWIAFLYSEGCAPSSPSESAGCSLVNSVLSSSPSDVESSPSLSMLVISAAPGATSSSVVSSWISSSLIVSLSGCSSGALLRDELMRIGSSSISLLALPSVLAGWFSPFTSFASLWLTAAAGPFSTLLESSALLLSFTLSVSFVLTLLSALSMPLVLLLTFAVSTLFVLSLPVLSLPVLSLPVLSLPVLSLPVLSLPVLTLSITTLSTMPPASSADIEPSALTSSSNMQMKNAAIRLRAILSFRVLFSVDFFILTSSGNNC